MSTAAAPQLAAPMTSAQAPMMSGPDYANIYAQQQMPYFDNNMSFDPNLSAFYQEPDFGYDMSGIDFGGWQPDAGLQQAADNYDWGNFIAEQDQALLDAGWGDVGYTEMPVFDAGALADWETGDLTWW